MNIYDCLRLPLGDVPAECIERFDCGREDINNFFHHDVERNQRQMFGKTYFSATVHQSVLSEPLPLPTPVSLPATSLGGDAT